MKKISLFISGLIMTCSVYAQNNNAIVPEEPIRQSKFSLGIKGGVGHSFIMPYSNYTFNMTSNVGLSAVLSPLGTLGSGNGCCLFFGRSYV